MSGSLGMMGGTPGGLGGMSGSTGAAPGMMMAGPGSIGGGGLGAASPAFQQLIGQFAKTSPEQLQQMVAQYGPQSPYGQAAAMQLRSRQMMAGSGDLGGWTGRGQPMMGGPGAQWRTAPEQPVRVSVEGGEGAGAAGQGEAANSAGDGSADASSGGEYRRGGVPKFAVGGMSASEGDPWWTRSADRGQTSGLLYSAIGGRTDHIPANPVAGSYVIPADVVSGLGEGNTLAGARVLDQMMHTGPYGQALPRVPTPNSRYARMPGPPPMATPYREARGGSTNERAPALFAGGEYVVAPEDAQKLGAGDLVKGHKVLDNFVSRVRKANVAKTAKLPAPVGAAKRK